VLYIKHHKLRFDQEKWRFMKHKPWGDSTNKHGGLTIKQVDFINANT
jgi:hypothetical protein